MKQLLPAPFAVLSAVALSFAVFAVSSAAMTAVAVAGETNVAVAANFTQPSKEIAAAFEKATGHKAVLSFGPTGQFYTQIQQDAPFTVFLAADDATPKKAETEGLAVKGSRFTYAIGQLVLWSKDAKLVTGEDTLRTAKFEKLSIANPTVAPYGAAAIQVMTKMGVYDGLKGKIVQGNSIAQAFQFIDTANAELGFVALSQVIMKNEGSSWPVPGTMYDPIRQDAVLLKKGESDEAAKAFLAFLKGPEAAAVIAKYGYGSDK